MMKKTEKPDSNAPETPYLSARREWNERYGDYIKAAHHWRIAAIGSISIALVCSGGMVYQATQQKIVPFAVEFNGHHEPVRVVRTDVFSWLQFLSCQYYRYVAMAVSLLGIESATETKV